MDSIEVVFEYPENVLTGNSYSTFYKFVRTLWFKTATMQNVTKLHLVSGPEDVEGKIKSACDRFGIEFIVNPALKMQFIPVIHRYCEDGNFEKLYKEICDNAVSH